MENLTKNIPIPTETQYKVQLIKKIEAVIKRMRWKAIYFDQEVNSDKNIYGLKCDKCPPPVKALTSFEKDLFILTKKIKF